MQDTESGLWGMFDREAYVHYSYPLNGDLHDIVPGRLVAFKGPRDLDGSPYEDGASGSRVFCPKYIASLLHDMDVPTVIRLNAAEYDRRFSRQGSGTMTCTTRIAPRHPASSLPSSSES
jgi:hypothetical protein